MQRRTPDERDPSGGSPREGAERGLRTKLALPGQGSQAPGVAGLPASAPDPAAAISALPRSAREVAQLDLDRLGQAAAGVGESAPFKAHLEWMLALPWHAPEAPAVDLVAARTALDRDLVDLAEVKQRVLEFLAVLRPGGAHPTTPICLVGPPGTGKATLARSIAAAAGRPFVRTALGGVGDDARVRGVRLGQPTAGPGEILDGLRRAGARDPVFLLDGIDALGAGEVNDPAGALVQALDPESSGTFLDLYLGVPFDVSRTFFVATAGVVYDIPFAVRERLDVITLAGYTPDEKFLIARRALLPRALEQADLDPAHVTLTDDALAQVVHGYTREAGVRSLARSLARITRTLALRFRAGSALPARVEAGQVADLLGPPLYEDDALDRAPVVGLATGLSWTADGGVVQLIEATAMEGTGRIVVTGRLGDVMRESADIAYSWVRANGASLGLNPERMRRLDLHVHAPEGGVRKDGPSAGVALATAIVSVFTRRAVLPDVAMTGELTLRGRVLDVAGIREKVSAAQRAGIHHVLLPAQNQKDVAGLPAALTRRMRFQFFDRMEQYLEAALMPAPGETSNPAR